MMARVRVAVVGAGAMGRAWLATVRGSPDVTLAAVVDVRPDVAASALSDLELAGRCIRRCPTSTCRSTR